MTDLLVSGQDLYVLFYGADILARHHIPETIFSSLVVALLAFLFKELKPNNCHLAVASQTAVAPLRSAISINLTWDESVAAQMFEGNLGSSNSSVNVFLLAQQETRLKQASNGIGNCVSNMIKEKQFDYKV